MALWILPFFMTVAASLVTAASPVGSITSAREFLVKGNRVSMAGVSSWPLVVGDELVLVNSSGLISFRDGTRVFLHQHSRIRIEGNSKRIIFRVINGSGAFELSPTATSQGLVGFASKILTCTGPSAMALIGKREIGRPPGCPDFPTPPPPPMSPVTPPPDPDPNSGNGSLSLATPSTPTPDTGPGSITMPTPGSGSVLVACCNPPPGTFSTSRRPAER